MPDKPSIFDDADGFSARNDEVLISPEALQAQIGQLLVGRRLVRVAFTQARDARASVLVGADIDDLQLVMEMDNKFCYVIHLKVAQEAVLQRTQAVGMASELSLLPAPVYKS